MADEKKVTKRVRHDAERIHSENDHCRSGARGVPMFSRHAFAAKKRDYILIGRAQPELGSHFRLR